MTPETLKAPPYEHHLVLLHVEGDWMTFEGKLPVTETDVVEYIAEAMHVCDDGSIAGVYVERRTPGEAPRDVSEDMLSLVYDLFRGYAENGERAPYNACNLVFRNYGWEPLEPMEADA